jgi:tripartite-type tricarboxylate transporter receptor subunit TctC
VNASAQTTFPNRPVKILVPYAPGGATDTVARILAEEMRKTWNEAVVVENKVGASGIIALEELARARPDGHILMMGNVSTNALTPILLRDRMRMDYDREIVTVARAGDVAVYLNSTTTNFPPTTFADMVAYAKARPGQVRYSSAGIGSIQQVDMAVLEHQTGIKLVHIPTRAGAAHMTRDLIAGDTQLTWGNPAASGRYVQAGQMRPLAVVGRKRLPTLPDVPSMAELGLPEVGSIQWQSLLAPAGTPLEVQEEIFQAIQKAHRALTVLQAFERTSFSVPEQSSLAEVQTWMASELARYRRIVTDLDIKSEEQ